MPPKNTNYIKGGGAATCIVGPEGAATCIVNSGGYEDDKDDGTTIIYTGQGGNDRLATRTQTAHQELLRGNLALTGNFHHKIPVRVVRGH